MMGKKSERNRVQAGDYRNVIISNLWAQGFGKGNEIVDEANGVGQSELEDDEFIADRRGT